MSESKLRAELLALQKSKKVLHAQDVVSWAQKHKGSALHKHFVWDDQKAADEYRLWQARRLIQIHVVTEEGGPVLVSLSVDRKEGGGYRQIEDVVKNRDLSEVMLQDALGELDRVRKRYDRVRQLTKVWAEIDRVKAAAERRKAA